MIKLLVRKFVKDYENTGDPKVRARYMTLSGVLGICCNAFLFAVKLAVGIITASISITSDAFNNLSDMGTSVVSIAGARLSDKRPDKDHPFGHGRIEYIASLVMAMLIMVFGVELLKTSVEGIIDPKPVALSVPLIVILAASILVKVWMFVYNRYLGKKIGSSLLEATARDSISDCFSTLAVIAGAILTMVFGGKAFEGTFWSKIPFDGIIGVLVSLLIIWNGFSMAKEVVGLLLGGPPDPDLVKSIEELVLGGKDILGVHDLIVHDYGPGRVIASAHAEVPYKGDIVEIHETIDRIETEAREQLGIVLVIHMDPVVNDSPRVDALKALAESICKEFDEAYSIHDFRITDGEERVNLIFDMVVPTETPYARRREAEEFVARRLAEEDRTLHAVIQVESGY
ncbi:MAG: cation transporter [Clostridia bacterium]|nr:cation transporter [Clostridia bacterium]